MFYQDSSSRQTAAHSLSSRVAPGKNDTFTPQAGLMSRYEFMAVEDRCAALLTKNCMDNTSALVAYAAHLSSLIPQGQELSLIHISEPTRP